jgi:hypothetical protein
MQEFTYSKVDDIVVFLSLRRAIWGIMVYAKKRNGI